MHSLRLRVWTALRQMCVEERANGMSISHVQSRSFNTNSLPDEGTDRPDAGRFCLFVTSSDRGRDIFEIVFQNAEKMWRDCDWPRYVGFTSKYPDLYGFTALAAKSPSDWQGELGDQLDQLPDEIEYVYLTFEDSLFLSPVNGAKLNAIADLMVSQNLSYVSLIPLNRNIPGRVLEYVRRKLSKRPLRRLSFSEPYYSSLAAAIWKRSYLRSLLRRAGLIWDLEHVVTKEPHYAVWEPIVDHDQIVRKGQWVFHAKRLLASQGISLANSKREFRTVKAGIRDIRERIVWELGGFLSFRLRRRLNMISHRAPPSTGTISQNPGSAGTTGLERSAPSN
jgi:hypothetical protein